MTHDTHVTWHTDKHCTKVYDSSPSLSSSFELAFGFFFKYRALPWQKAYDVTAMPSGVRSQRELSVGVSSSCCSNRSSCYRTTSYIYQHDRSLVVKCQANDKLAGKHVFTQMKMVKPRVTWFCRCWHTTSWCTPVYNIFNMLYICNIMSCTLRASSLDGKRRIGWLITLWRRKYACKRCTSERWGV